MGEPSVINHGIAEDNSDFRIHVCPVAKKMYLFPTHEGREALRIYTGRYEAGQNGISGATAEGAKVPVLEIGGIRIVPIDNADLDEVNIQEAESTEIKGRKAEELVIKYFDLGRIPLPVKVHIARDKESQFSGVDLRAGCSCTIQVKCDYRGGIGYGATGNLYIQTKERNPLKRI